MLGLLALAQRGVNSWQWFQDGGALTIDVADLMAIGDGLAAHIASTYATWGAVVAAIKAQPAVISTRAQIDAPDAVGLSSWPS